MTGGGWVEESERETPYDGGEDEGAGIRSYLVVSMLAYGGAKGHETGRKEEREGRTAFIAKGEYREYRKTERESKRKRRKDRKSEG